MVFLVLRSAHQHRRDDQHRRQDEYGFTGLTWRIPIYKGFFFEGEFGAAVNTSPLRDEPGRVNTGCRWDFRESGGFGYQFSEHWVVIANIEHISHASLCTHINPG